MTFQEYTQGHMWYMPMILGLYLFVPFVVCAVQRLGLRAFAVPVCVAGFFSFVQPPANVVLLALGRAPLGGVLSLDFRGGVYGLLLAGGYLARRGCLAPRARRLAGAGRHCVLCRAGVAGVFRLRCTAWRTMCATTAFFWRGGRCACSSF